MAAALSDCVTGRRHSPLPTSTGSACRHASICRSLRRRSFGPRLESSSASTSSWGSLGTRCRLRSNPAARKSRISVGSVGCRRDRSYAEIIVAGTPARSLSCPWLRPLLIRASCKRAAAGDGVSNDCAITRLYQYTDVFIRVAGHPLRSLAVQCGRPFRPRNSERSGPHRRPGTPHAPVLRVAQGERAGGRRAQSHGRPIRASRIRGRGSRSSGDRNRPGWCPVPPRRDW
jgi:hypothetical protein